MNSQDCFYIQNPAGGGVGAHNGRCARGLTDDNVHLGATHHVRIGGWCGHVCGQCARSIERARKDAKIHEIEVIAA